MANTVRKNKFWLIAVFVLIAALGTLFGLQRIYAQSTPTELPPPGSSSGGAAAPAAVPAAGGATGAGGATASGGGGSIPTEPDVSFGQVVHGKIASTSKRNWDGRVFSSLKFKYHTVDGRVLTVILPAEYKSEKKTRAGWETLFMVYAMDTEIAQDYADRNRPPDVSAFMGKLMAEIRGGAANRPAPEVISEAMEKAKAYLPSMGIGNMSMPPALPGMP